MILIPLTPKRELQTGSLILVSIGRLIMKYTLVANDFNFIYKQHVDVSTVQKNTCVDATIDVLLLVHMSSNLVLECQIFKHIECFGFGE